MRGSDGEERGRDRGQASGAPAHRHATPADAKRETAPCDVCGVAALIWRKCKLVCENCGAINKTCADL